MIALSSELMCCPFNVMPALMVGTEFREIGQALPLRLQIVRHKARGQRFKWDLVGQ